MILAWSSHMVHQYSYLTKYISNIKKQAERIIFSVAWFQVFHLFNYIYVSLLDVEM